MNRLTTWAIGALAAFAVCGTEAASRYEDCKERASRISGYEGPSGTRGDRAVIEGAARGAVRGAIAGAAVGWVAGNDAGRAAGRGLALGALAGGVSRAARRNGEDERAGVYQRALDDCMEDR